MTDESFPITLKVERPTSSYGKYYKLNKKNFDTGDISRNTFVFLKCQWILINAMTLGAFARVRVFYLNRVAHVFETRENDKYYEVITCEYTREWLLYDGNDTPTDLADKRIESWLVRGLVWPVSSQDRKYFTRYLLTCPFTICVLVYLRLSQLDVSYTRLLCFFNSLLLPPASNLGYSSTSYDYVI